MNKKVMFLCDYISLYGGNFVPSLMALEDALKEKEISCIYVFPEEASERFWFKKLEEMGKCIETYMFHGTKIQKIREIKGLVDKYKVSILHSHFTSVTAVEFLAVSNPNLRVFIHIHSDFDLGTYGLKQRFRDIRMYRLLSGNVRFLSVSKDFVIHNPKKIRWVPNALATNRVTCEHAGGDYIRELLNVKKDETLILMFGWSPIVKGVDIAINAIKQINEECLGRVKIAVVCGREITPMKMKQWIISNTNCNGNESYLCYLEPTEDVFSYYEAADILLSASRSEGFSYAILEMLSLGKRCVISDIPGVSWAKEFETVVPFMTENAESCANGLLKAIRSVSPKSDKTIAKIRQEYSIVKWANTIIEEYGV